MQNRKKGRIAELRLLAYLRDYFPDVDAPSRGRVMNVPGADLVTGELAIEVKSIKTDNSFSAIYDIVKHSSPQAVELYEFSLHRLHHVTTVVFLENFVKGDMCMDSPYLFVLPISAKLRGFLAQARSQADGKKPVCIVRLDSHPIGQSLTFI